MDYQAMLKRLHARRGECDQCGKALHKCSCKTAAVNPMAVASGRDVTSRGDEIHAPLMVNPYAGSPDAVQFENGYQFAQQLGHQALGQAGPDDLAEWRQHSLAWRSGFVEAASYLGCKVPVESLLQDTKTAMDLLICFAEPVKLATSADALTGAATELPPDREDSPMPVVSLYRQRPRHSRFRVVGGDQHHSSNSGPGADVPAAPGVSKTSAFWATEYFTSRMV